MLGGGRHQVVCGYGGWHGRGGSIVGKVGRVLTFVRAEDAKMTNLLFIATFYYFVSCLGFFLQKKRNPI